MSHRNGLTNAAAIVVGLMILGARAAPIAGQGTVPAKPAADTSKKTTDTLAKHIKITKEPRETKASMTPMQAGGEVCMPLSCPVAKDSVDRAVAAAAAVADSTARADQRRQDAIAGAARVEEALAGVRVAAREERERTRRDSIVRADAADREAQLALRRHMARGFYIGIAGGASTPQRDIRNGYTGGWNTTIPVGWDQNDSPLGFRGDFSVDHLNGTRVHDQSTVTTAASGDITVWSLNGDVKLRAHAPGALSRTNLYALGGIGAHRVVNGVYGTIGPNAGQNLGFNDARTNFGWNVGAGVSMAWGPTELFIESRFFQIKSDLAYHLNGGVGTYTTFTPIVFGLQWF